MVNYRGPRAIRPLVEALEIPIFNRVSEINYLVRDVGEIRLEKDEVASLHQLDEIVVTKQGAKPVVDSEVQTVSELVPACRLKNVEKTKNQISLQVSQGSRFACCSP